MYIVARYNTASKWGVAVIEIGELCPHLLLCKTRIILVGRQRSSGSRATAKPSTGGRSAFSRLTCSPAAYVSNIISSHTNEESNSTLNSCGRKFLDNSKGLDVINLVLKILRALGAY